MTIGVKASCVALHTSLWLSHRGVIGLPHCSTLQDATHNPFEQTWRPRKEWSLKTKTDQSCDFNREHELRVTVSLSITLRRQHLSQRALGKIKYNETCKNVFPRCLVLSRHLINDVFFPVNEWPDKWGCAKQEIITKTLSPESFILTTKHRGQIGLKSLPLQS